MISFPQKILSYKSLVRNFTSLSILQAANYLFPLIILPYVVRVLGPEKFGLVNFAAAFVAYFSMVSDYGFNLSGTKAIALNRDNKDNLSNIFSTILIIKTILMLLVLLIFILIIFCFIIFQKNLELYLISFGMVLGGVLYPAWFYQGIEQMKYITIIQVAVRSLNTLLIFLLIKEENDFLLLALLYSASQILIGILGLVIAVLKFKIRLCWQPVKEVVIFFKSGWSIFMSTLSINLYTTSNTFILGLFANEAVVGYFAAADKIRIAFQGLQSILSQSVFPYVNKLAEDSYDKFIIFNKRLLKLTIGVGLMASLFIFTFAYQISDLLLGEEYLLSGELLRIISLLPFVISLSNVFGIQTMIPLGYEKSFNMVISFAALFHIILMFILVPAMMATGVVIAIVITEVIISASMFIFIRNKKIPII